MTLWFKGQDSGSWLCYNQNHQGSFGNIQMPHPQCRLTQLAPPRLGSRPLGIKNLLLLRTEKQKECGFIVLHIVLTCPHTSAHTCCRRHLRGPGQTGAHTFPHAEMGRERRVQALSVEHTTPTYLCSIILQHVCFWLVIEPKSKAGFVKETLRVGCSS